MYRFQRASQSAIGACMKLPESSPRISTFHRSAVRNRFWRISCLLGIALLLGPQLVHGQQGFKWCMESCFSICDSGPEFLALGCRDRCIGSCQEQTKNIPVPTPYGAIAFGTRGAEGISWNKASWAAAGQSAVATCSKYGSNCKVVYQYQNTCAALAVAKGGQHFETATGNTEKQAEATATAMCRQRWGICLSDLSACSMDKGSQVTRTSPPPPRPQGGASWGAIAYSASDMKAGWSFGKVDRALAEKEAMNACSQLGKACVLQTAFNKQCAALAADRSFVGWATSTQPREAQQKAVEQCAKDGGRNCALHVFFCSF